MTETIVAAIIIAALALIALAVFVGSIVLFYSRGWIGMKDIEQIVQAIRQGGVQ